MGAFPGNARALSLAEAQARMFAHNRELLAARRAVESAQAGELIAGARPNAVLSLNSTSINLANTIDGQKRTADTIVRIDQPFERGNKRELRLDAASGLESAARADSLDVLRQQLAALQGAYFDLKQAEERSRVLEETATLFSRTLAAAQARRKAGDLAPADVAKVQVDAERAQNDARAARADVARAQLALAYLIGAERGAADLAATDPWPGIERPALAKIDDLVEARPDVLAAKRRLEAAQKLSELAQAQRTRDVTIGAQYERWMPGGAPTQAVGIGIAVPLFTGYDYSGDIRKAEVDRYAAVDALARSRALALGELERTASDLESAADRVERYEGSLVAAAERSAQAAEFAFSRGAISVLEVLDARRTLRAVELEAVAALADYSKALAAWRAATMSADSLKTRMPPG